MQEEKQNLYPLQKEIMAHLEKYKALTRADLVELTGRARTTIYGHLYKLICMGLIYKKTRQVNLRGRPVVFFCIKR